MENQKSNYRNYVKVIFKLAAPFCLVMLFALYKSTSADVIYSNSHNIMFYGFCAMMLIAFIALAHLVLVSFNSDRFPINLDQKED